MCVCVRLHLLKRSVGGEEAGAGKRRGGGLTPRSKPSDGPPEPGSWQRGKGFGAGQACTGSESFVPHKPSKRRAEASPQVLLSKRQVMLLSSRSCENPMEPGVDARRRER